MRTEEQYALAAQYMAGYDLEKTALLQGIKAGFKGLVGKGTKQVVKRGRPTAPIIPKMKPGAKPAAPPVSPKGTQLHTPATAETSVLQKAPAQRKAVTRNVRPDFEVSSQQLRATPRSALQELGERRVQVRTQRPASALPTRPDVAFSKGQLMDTPTEQLRAAFMKKSEALMAKLGWDRSMFDVVMRKMASVMHSSPIFQVRMGAA